MVYYNPYNKGWYDKAPTKQLFLPQLDLRSQVTDITFFDVQVNGTFLQPCPLGSNILSTMLVRMKAFSMSEGGSKSESFTIFKPSFVECHKESVDELDRSLTYRSPSETPLLGRLSAARQQAQMLSSFLRHGSQDEQLQEIKRHSGQRYFEDKKYFSCSKHLCWAFREI